MAVMASLLEKPVCRIQTQFPNHHKPRQTEHSMAVGRTSAPLGNWLCLGLFRPEIGFQLGLDWLPASRRNRSGLGNCAGSSPRVSDHGTGSEPNLQLTSVIGESRPAVTRRNHIGNRSNACTHAPRDAQNGKNRKSKNAKRSEPNIGKLLSHHSLGPRAAEAKRCCPNHSRFAWILPSRNLRCRRYVIKIESSRLVRRNEAGPRPLQVCAALSCRAKRRPTR
jgi:hypothetical protein